MKFKSRRIGGGLSRLYIYTDTKNEELARKKYDYCTQEIAVIDTRVKDNYTAYMGAGIIENCFYRENGLMYNISTDFETKNGELYYIVKYTIYNIRINLEEYRVNIDFRYSCKGESGFRNTLNKFIKDLFLTGIWSLFYIESDKTEFELKKIRDKLEFIPKIEDEEIEY